MECFQSDDIPQSMEVCGFLHMTPEQVQLIWCAFQNLLGWF